MALQRLSEEGWRKSDYNKQKLNVSTASRLMGVSHIYDSVCYSSASLQSLSVTLTQLHSVRGKENKVETERWKEWGRNREKMSHRYTDKNKNIMKSEPEKKAVLEDLEEERYGVLHQ